MWWTHFFLVFPSVSQLIITSNNQTLQSADDKDRRSNAVILRKFYKTDGQNTRDQISRGRRSKRV